MELEQSSQFDAMVRKNGSSKVITIPCETIKKLKLKLNEIIVVIVKKENEVK